MTDDVQTIKNGEFLFKQINLMRDVPKLSITLVYVPFECALNHGWSNMLKFGPSTLGMHSKFGVTTLGTLESLGKCNKFSSTCV